MEEIKIEPLIKVGPGSCPKCLMSLTIADRETNVMKLNQDGSVLEFIDCLDYCSSICPNCGFTQRMMRSNGIYKPYSELVREFDRIDLEEVLEKRSKGKYSIDVNPLLDL